MTAQELHEHAIAMALQAWDATTAHEVTEACRDRYSDDVDVTEAVAEARAKFQAAVRERLAQSAQLAACETATSSQALDLLSAAEWLDEADEIAALEAYDAAPPEGARWRLIGHGQAWNRAATLPAAILSAARSLGWKQEEG